jgi:hypothetical protein
LLISSFLRLVVADHVLQLALWTKLMMSDSLRCPLVLGGNAELSRPRQVWEGHSRRLIHQRGADVRNIPQVHATTYWAVPPWQRGCVYWRRPAAAQSRIRIYMSSVAYLRMRRTDSTTVDKFRTSAQRHPRREVFAQRYLQRSCFCRGRPVPCASACWQDDNGNGL